MMEWICGFSSEMKNVYIYGPFIGLVHGLVCLCCDGRNES